MPSFPSLPKHLKMPSKATKLKVLLEKQLNFYRLHLLFFTFTPLILSGVMYGVSTAYHIAYIDCLFLCMSSMTVTGLATVDLSTLSAFQQFILFFQQIIGSLVFVSIVMIMVRQHFFRATFRHAIRERQKRSSSFSISKTISKVNPGQGLSNIRRKLSMSVVGGKTKGEPVEDSAHNGSPAPSSVEMKPVAVRASQDQAERPKTPVKHTKAKKGIKVSKDMIKRVEGGGVGMMNPMGWYDAEHIGTPDLTPTREEDRKLGRPSIVREEIPENAIQDELGEGDLSTRLDLLREERIGPEDRDSHEVEPPARIMVESPPPMEGPDEAPPSKVAYAGMALTDGGYMPRTATTRSIEGASRFPRTGTTGEFPRTYSLRPTVSRKPEAKYSNFGGFPTPLEIIEKLASKAFPKASKSLSRTLTMPRANTISGRGSTIAEGDAAAKEVPYITFSAVVGRNSRFTGLTEDQVDELGGVEYRALRALLWIVVIYFVFVQFAGFIIMAPYVAAGGRYDYVFEEQPQLVSIWWFALFQSVSAFSNTGMSLVDQSMVPFQTAYLMIVVMIILILAGNTAFPIYLRATVWTIYKCVPKTSRLRETLKFLLDHPRRCFVYMFPSTQTWVLMIVMMGLTLIDWVSFLVLDIGTPAIESIPVGTRIIAGLLQSAAVRAAGFGIVPLSALAPAVKVLYVIMMYVSVYPIALSVRSTNVYEEKSLGLFGDEEDEEDMEYSEKGAQAVAKYVGWHARRQLAFDIWWLAFALWLLCIIERGPLNDTANATWFNIFSIIFELVSAYGTVGLSLGVPYDNYSFSGAFSVLGKLVVVAVMLRGRHRGLPVAIDRAVMLPKDFTAQEEQAFEEERSRRLSRRGSGLIPEDYRESFRRGSASGVSASRRDSSPFEGQSPVLSPTHRPSTSTSASHQHSQQSQYPSQHQHQHQQTYPTSPTALSFALPRTSTEEMRERGRSGTVGRSGTLSPVQESGMSRAPTRQARGGA
ncbi:low affinity potassium transporter [Saitozyma podzolica]|uniref:Potassium transport protein n=1 Tax=Saitozyma podzolica TaxID=1890683 RepID=A0A427Y2F0_9TREE|nr:low affinity potassium transporter [Saitozyma podzolica]